MKKITEFIQAELYPAIRANADRAFPEMEFTRRGSKWTSTHDLQGGAHKSHDQSVIKGENAFGIYEQVGGVTDFLDYVKQRDNTDTIGAVKNLCSSLGLQLPSPSTYDIEEFKRKEQKSKSLLDYYQEAVNELRDNKSHEANAVNSYLERRGYSKGEIDAMCLGVVTPSIYSKMDEALKQDKGYKSNFSIGRDYVLLLPPYKDINGRITGFKVRATENKQPKYMFTSGVDKSSTFYQISRARSKEQPLLLVEGELDAMRAKAKGISNIAAIAGQDIHKEQLHNAKRLGYTRFVLLPDVETKDEERSRSVIRKQIETIIREGYSSFVAFLPLEGEKTDMDSYLGNHTKEELQGVLANHIPGYTWLLLDLWATCTDSKEWKYYSLSDKGLNHPTNIQIEQLRRGLYLLGAMIKRYDLAVYDEYIETVFELTGISERALDAEATKIAEQQLKQQRDKELSTVILSLKDMKPEQQLQAMREAVANLDEEEASIRFADFLKPDTEESIKAEMALDGEDFHTGYYFDTLSEDDKELLLPNKAISFVVAPTSHGKSTMLINLALRLAQRYPDKKILYLSYEESKGAVITSFLNVYAAMNGATPSKGHIRSSIRHDLQGDGQFISQDQENAYRAVKKAFFGLLREGRLNIRYVDFDADTLTNFIKFMRLNDAADIVFIDYMQLLEESDGTKKSRQEQLKGISQKLRKVAVDEKLGLPIVLAAQFNRQTTSPLELVSTNIGEAGDIERVANTILALWNCGFTKIDKQHTAKDMEAEYKGLSEKGEGTIYAKVIKRRGQLPNVKAFLSFDGKTGLISQDGQAGDGAGKAQFADEDMAF